MRWTEEQLALHLAKTGVPARAPAVDTSRPPFALSKRLQALGRLKTGEMNKTEARYDAHLWELRHSGAILWHKFEGIKLRLADNTFYTCDFSVLAADCALEMHEIKGFMLDDANVKIKVAASLYPFRFFIVKAKAKRDGGGFSVVQHGA